MAERQSQRGGGAPAPLTLAEAVRRFGIVPADLVDLAPTDQEELADDEPRPDDPEDALGRRIARVNVEEIFATVYLTFDDGWYLIYAARLDEEGVILLDGLREPALAYSDYWIFDELEGESGPPPPDRAPTPGTAYDPATWTQAAGRTLSHIGWYEEGMQVFLHFAEGGSAYLAGCFVAEDPRSDEDYAVFDLPAPPVE